MKRLVPLLLSLLVSLSLADAGYLGSVSSGPSLLPAVGEHPDIAMTAEEVIIELHPPELFVHEDGWEESLSRATINAQFLFSNHGSATEVVMYMPVGITTVFSPSFPSGVYDDELFEHYRVTTEDGELPLRRAFVGEYDPEWKHGLSWEEFARLVEPLFPEEPKPGEPFFFRNIQLAEDVSLPEGFSTWNPLHHAESMIIYWSVSFAEGEEQLVFYHEEYSPSSDYEMRSNQLTYPLFTGAGWSSPIGWGRVAVVVSESYLWDELFFYTGVAMPPPTWQEDFVETNLTTLALGRGNERALVWEFEEFEPITSEVDWYSFYPELGDLGTYLIGELDLSEEPPEQPWSSSYIQLAWGEGGNSYFVVPFEGLPLYDAAHGEELDRIAFGTATVQVLEVIDGWAEVTIHDYLADTENKGWIELYPLDDAGLVKPTILPML